MRIYAIGPAPSGDASCGSFRRGVCGLSAARGPVRPVFRDEIPAPETPQDPPPDARADGRRSRHGLSPVESARARAAAVSGSAVPEARRACALGGAGVRARCAVI